MVAVEPVALLRLFPILFAVGCFYSDGINQRPSLDIHQSGDAVFRTATVTFTATGVDPDGDSIAYSWRAYACTAGACDQVPFQTGTSPDFAATLPMFRLDPCGVDRTCEFDTLHVTLDGRDSYGATSRPTQTLDLALVDQAPRVELRKDPRHAYVVSTPVNVYALLSDPDDLAEDLPITWTAFGPANENETASALVDPSLPPAAPSYQKIFTPNMDGLWTIRVATNDPSGMPGSTDLPIQVDADHAPCLTQWTPAATTLPNTTIPLTDPTLFQIQVVTDDLDPYPSSPNPPIGVTEFHWSIVPPNGTRQQLAGVTGNAIPLDPASYHPGDIVELRVEIQDRNHTPVNCPDGDLTCSVISDNACLQRLTWRVEVR